VADFIDFLFLFTFVQFCYFVIFLGGLLGLALSGGFGWLVNLLVVGK
jgi:hypothetical protein